MLASLKSRICIVPSSVLRSPSNTLAYLVVCIQACELWFYLTQVFWGQFLWCPRACLFEVYDLHRANGPPSTSWLIRLCVHYHFIWPEVYWGQFLWWCLLLLGAQYALSAKLTWCDYWPQVFLVSLSLSNNSCCCCCCCCCGCNTCGVVNQYLPVARSSAMCCPCQAMFYQHVINLVWACVFGWMEAEAEWRQKNVYSHPLVHYTVLMEFRACHMAP